MSETEHLDQLFDQLTEIEQCLRAIAAGETDTTIIAACDLAADYVNKAAWAAYGRIQDISIAAEAAEENPCNPPTMIQSS